MLSSGGSACWMCMCCTVNLEHSYKGMLTDYLCSRVYCSCNCSMDAWSTSGAPKDVGLSSHRTTEIERSMTWVCMVLWQNSQAPAQQAKQYMCCMIYRLYIAGDLGQSLFPFQAYEEPCVRKRQGHENMNHLDRLCA